jgi:ABC-type uncharacterized transport system substrate-binding protein
MRQSAWMVLRRLSLGVTLIVAASTVLLLSDRKRDAADKARVPRVALLKYASRPLLDDLANGMTDGLAERGYVAGRTMELKVFDGQNDMPTVATIATEMAGGGYDLLLSVSTPCLQAVARANQQSHIRHVFAGVTDPFGAGVGMQRGKPLDHPPYLVGVGTFQPVSSLFRLVKTEVCPGLRRVGSVWNPSETCSEACTLEARKICRELGIALVEASIDKASDVAEAANALVGQGVEALWLGGDNTVEMAIDTLVAAAAKGRIPVFCNTPDLVQHGALVGLGANYPDVGRRAGLLAADVLDGADTRRIPIENVVPERLALNLKQLKHLKGGWRIPDALRARADLTVDERGTHEKPRAARPKASTAGVRRQQRVCMVRYVDALHAEEGCRGVLAGLRAAGLKEGRDLIIDQRTAQGDVATLNSILDMAKADQPDLLVAICTPTLQAAMQRFTHAPIVYTVVASGVEAGAGQSRTEHRPNVTGIDTEGAYQQMAEIVKQCLPLAKRMGTLYTPGESNSVFNRALLEKSLQRVGVELISVPANSPAEVADAALALTAKQLDAVCQVMDNLGTSCFASIVAAANRARLPVFSFVGKQIREGSLLTLARDYFDAGHEAGLVAARVLRGESPAQIPFTIVKRARLTINPQRACMLGIEVPPTLLKRADEVIPP